MFIDNKLKSVCKWCPGQIRDYGIERIFCFQKYYFFITLSKYSIFKHSFLLNFVWFLTNRHFVGIVYSFADWAEWFSVIQLLLRAPSQSFLFRESSLNDGGSTFNEEQGVVHSIITRTCTFCTNQLHEIIEKTGPPVHEFVRK